ncbi:MAG: transcriptional regulator [Pseudomonadota bacterium]
MNEPTVIELHGPQPDDDEFDIPEGDISSAMAEAEAIWSGEADPSTYVVHHPPETVDVKAIRNRTGLTQKAFAERFAFSASAVRDWEQNRRKPEGPARTLLMVIEKRPDVVEEVLVKVGRV